MSASKEGFGGPVTAQPPLWSATVSPWPAAVPPWPAAVPPWPAAVPPYAATASAGAYAIQPHYGGHQPAHTCDWTKRLARWAL